MGSLGDVGEMAPRDRKGDIDASYYVVVYVGTAVPAIGVGALAQAAGLPTAIAVFAAVVIVICLAGLAGLIVETRNRAGSGRMPGFRVAERRSTSRGAAPAR
jgi:hypothetical protein